MAVPILTEIGDYRARIQSALGVLIDRIARGQYSYAQQIFTASYLRTIALKLESVSADPARSLNIEGAVLNPDGTFTFGNSRAERFDSEGRPFPNAAFLGGRSFVDAPSLSSADSLRTADGFQKLDADGKPVFDVNGKPVFEAEKLTEDGRVRSRRRDIRPEFRSALRLNADGTVNPDGLVNSDGSINHTATPTVRPDFSLEGVKVTEDGIVTVQSVVVKADGTAARNEDGTAVLVALPGEISGNVPGVRVDGVPVADPPVTPAFVTTPAEDFTAPAPFNP